jgi:hypothetical protein
VTDLAVSAARIELTGHASSTIAVENLSGSSINPDGSMFGAR